MRYAAHPSRKPAVLLWTAAILTFLLLSIAASLRADAAALGGRASRTAHFNASGKVTSVAVENVNGDVKVVAGAAVTATVELAAKARTDADAKKALDDTKTIFENHDGSVEMTVEPPGTRVRRNGTHGWSITSRDHDGVSVEARWTVTVPAGVAVDVSTVNGTVTSEGVASELQLSAVNGKLLFSGARGGAKLNVVNGDIDGSFAALPREAEVKADAVNGNITMRLPRGAGFRLKAHTMSGDVLSTYALPAAAAEAAATGDVAREKARLERDRARLEREKAREKARIDRRRGHEDDDEELDVDLTELNRSMADLERDMADLSRSISRDVMMNLNRSYEGTVGGGGATLKLSNLNGKIVVLEEGAKESDARTLVSRRGHVITVPPRAPRAPLPPRAGVPPVAPIPPERIVVRVPRVPRVPRPPMGIDGDDGDASVVQGDVTGDFLTTLPMGDVKVGKVSGRARISTHAGQITVERAGNGAELKSLGGDVSIGDVAGDLRATTLGGGVEAGSVSGEARLETQGGDIVLKSCGGSVTASTGGGDVALHAVRGGVRAATSGGSVSCEITSADVKPSELSSQGGDVTLTLPANAKATVEILVQGVDREGSAVVSDFPEITVERGHGRVSASGRLGGGGARVVLRSTSGTVTLKRGPNA